MEVLPSQFDSNIQFFRNDTKHTRAETEKNLNIKWNFIERWLVLDFSTTLLSLLILISFGCRFAQPGMSLLQPAVIELKPEITDKSLLVVKPM